MSVSSQVELKKSACSKPAKQKNAPREDKVKEDNQDNKERRRSKKSARKSKIASSASSTASSSNTAHRSHTSSSRSRSTSTIASKKHHLTTTAAASSSAKKATETPKGSSRSHKKCACCIVWQSIYQIFEFLANGRLLVDEQDFGELCLTGNATSEPIVINLNDAASINTGNKYDYLFNLLAKLKCIKNPVDPSDAVNWSWDYKSTKHYKMLKFKLKLLSQILQLTKVFHMNLLVSGTGLGKFLTAFSFCFSFKMFVYLYEETKNRSTPLFNKELIKMVKFWKITESQNYCFYIYPKNEHYQVVS